jgi:CHASE2 domain-containing sensor protein
LKKYYDILFKRKVSYNNDYYDDNYYYITNFKKIPFSKTSNNKILINYIDRNKFQKISFLDVYKKNFDENFFKNKIVLV